MTQKMLLGDTPEKCELNPSLAYDHFYTECMYRVRNECGELILRHLYDMNESDFKEACKYGLGGASNPVSWLQQFEQFEKRPIEGQGKLSGIVNPIKKRVQIKGGLKLIHYTFAPECLRFLLSKGFDVFELIPQGKAKYMYDF